MRDALNKEIEVLSKTPGTGKTVKSVNVIKSKPKSKIRAAATAAKHKKLVKKTNKKYKRKQNNFLFTGGCGDCLVK